jgi:hypothetical protein
MIVFKITKVSRHKSSEIRTRHFEYENGERKERVSSDAEWEEVEFTVNEEERPVISISNIEGDAFIRNTVKMFVNNPALFGTFKVGDLIPFKTPDKPEPSKGD